MSKNVVILGLDDFYREEVVSLQHPDRYTFHGLYDVAEVTNIEGVHFDALLEEGRRELAKIPGGADGIVIHWDFPSTELKAILCRELGLRSASLEAVLKCGHKYWSRVEQARIVPEATPDFCKIDPFAERPIAQLEIEYPFWLKPVKSYSSRLGFHVENEAQFHDAIEIIREEVHAFANPFDEALAHASLPPDIQDVSGNYCIAEQFIAGINIAPEGHVFNGDVRVHGIVNMVLEAGRESYQRCEYPSQVPQAVQDRLVELTKRLIQGIGYDNDCFNIEFFWDEKTDAIKVIEVNPRISRAHSNLFHQVDGESNHQIAVQVALGEKPEFDYGKGRYNIAGDFWWRKYEDALVEAVPSPEDIARVTERFPGTRVRIYPEVGKRVSDVRNQDSYSFVIADVMIGAENKEQMEEHYRQAQSMLPFRFKPL